VLTRRFAYVYARFQGRTAIHRRGPGDIWQGLWEPLLCDRQLPGGARLLKKEVKHQLTHRTLLVDFYLWEPAEKPVLPEGYVWINEAELDRYAKPRLFELLLENLPR
jgi:A/G-specific adenine glycosylase